jgi:hypothetical protein
MVRKKDKGQYTINLFYWGETIMFNKKTLFITVTLLMLLTAVVHSEGKSNEKIVNEAFINYLSPEINKILENQFGKNVKIKCVEIIKTKATLSNQNIDSHEIEILTITSKAQVVIMKFEITKTFNLLISLNLIPFKTKGLKETEYNKNYCDSDFLVSSPQDEPYYVDEEMDKVIEEALIMVLHDKIQTALKTEYKQRFVQYDSEKLIDAKKIKLPYGGKAFEIKVQLRKINNNQRNDLVIITLRTDQEVLGEFTVTEINVTPIN